VSRNTFKPPVLPPLPKNVKVAASGSGAKITWEPVAGDIAGYRVYRAEHAVRTPGADGKSVSTYEPGHEGEPLTLLNSPYRPEARADLIKGASYEDATGSPKGFYFVTAVDKDGHESSWFPDEPAPLPGKNAK